MLLSSAIGGGFGCVIASVSPEFVATLFSASASAAGHSIVRYAAAVGMIWGIFLGTAVMAFSLLLVTLIHVAGIIRKKREAPHAP